MLRRVHGNRRNRQPTGGDINRPRFGKRGLSDLFLATAGTARLVILAANTIE